MVFGSVLTAAELGFSRKKFVVHVSLLDSLHRILFQFAKNGSQGSTIGVRRVHTYAYFY